MVAGHYVYQYPTRALCTPMFNCCNVVVLLVFTRKKNILVRIITYVRFRSRASLGIMGDGAPSLSQWVGLDR